MMHASERRASYRVRVAGWLDPHWSERLDGWRLLPSADGSTLLERENPDQAALYGLLIRLRDLGLTLLAVERLEGP